MKCLNGHDMTENDAFCTLCGSRRATTTPYSSLAAPSASTPAPGAVATEHAAKKKPFILRPLGLALGITGVLLLIGVSALVVTGNSQKITVETIRYHAKCDELHSSDSVHAGASIKVRGPNGDLVGSGVYASGVNGHDYDSTHHWVNTCTFTTSFNVTKNLSRYRVTVGSGDAVSFGLNELKNNDWYATISSSYRYNPQGSYSDGYTWGYNNAYSTSDCDWWASGPANDDQYQWEAGCRAGYYANPY